MSLFVTILISSTINIIILIFSYFIIRNNLEKKLINKEVINNVKNEINSIMIQLNQTTLNNISLLEEKTQELDKTINLADKKRAHLESINFNPNNQMPPTQISKKNTKDFSYSPEKIVNQSRKSTEKVNNELLKIQELGLERELEKLSPSEQVLFLQQKGWDRKKIQKKLKLSSGELELLINMENLNF